MSAPAVKPFTIQEIKETILWRARQRQATIERGEYDVPIHYAPLPLATVLDLISQLDYRYDFLNLAVPPPSRSLIGRFKRFFKSLICKSLRWVLIRQVEFNLIALEQARAAADVSALADQNLGEFMAALTALKLQTNTLRQRMARLEGQAVCESPRAGGADISCFERSSADDGNESRQVHHVYLDYFKGHGPLVLAGCGRGDFLKLLVSEGLPARGIEADLALAEDCRERELPVVGADAGSSLGQLENDSLGGIFLGSALGSDSPHEIASLLGHCWTKLKKGGILIAEMPNSSYSPPEEAGLRKRGLSPYPQGDSPLFRSPCPMYASYRWEVPAELLGYLVESQCFTVIDYVFSAPAGPDITECVRTSTGLPFDRRRYQHYAVVGRK